MKIEFTCQNESCKYEFLDIDFIYPEYETYMECPNCSMDNRVKIVIELMGEYNEDKEDR